MDLTILSNLVGLTGFPAFIYYGGMIIVGLFMAGFMLRGYLSRVCDEHNRKTEASMSALEAKVEKLETEKVHLTMYTQGMNNVCDLIKEVRQEMKDNFTSLSNRIDQLLLHKETS